VKVGPERRAMNTFIRHADLSAGPFGTTARGVRLGAGLDAQGPTSTRPRVACPVGKGAGEMRGQAGDREGRAWTAARPGRRQFLGAALREKTPFEQE